MSHLPQHVVDQLSGGVLPPAAADASRAHTAQCPDCAQRVREAEQARTDFLAKNPPMLRAEGLLAAARPAWRWPRLMVPALAGALAVVGWLALRPSPADDLRARGDARVELQVQRAGAKQVTTEQPGVALHSGDRVQVQVTPGPFTDASLYQRVPGGGLSLLAHQSATGTVSLGPALELDDSPGPDELVVVFSNGPAPAPEVAELPAENTQVRVLSLRK